MSRVQFTFSEKPKSKRIHPVWRGVGCISVVIFTIGIYALSDLLMKINYPLIGVPPDVGFKIGPIPLPVRDSQLDFKTGALYSWNFSWIRLAFTAIVDIIIYGIAFIVYSLLNPLKPGPKDAPPVRPHKGRQKSLIR